MDCKTPLPINQKLIEGALHLLKSVYEYVPTSSSTESNSPKLFPENYRSTPFTHQLTKYQYHWKNPTHLYWGNLEGKKMKSLLWDCNGGRVQTITKNCENPWVRVVLDDCSGFIWGLFCFVNTVEPLDRSSSKGLEKEKESLLIETNFDEWKIGKKIPLVGVPVLNKKTFCDVRFNEIAPGDLVGWSLSFTNAKDGHIMLIGSVEDVGDDERAEKYLSIISVGTSHYRDLRLNLNHQNAVNKKRVSGIGLGYAKVRKNEKEKSYGFVDFKAKTEWNYFLRSKVVRALDTPQIQILKSENECGYLGLIKNRLNQEVLTYRHYRSTKDFGKSAILLPDFEKWIYLKGDFDFIYLNCMEKEFFCVGGRVGEAQIPLSPKLFDSSVVKLELEIAKIFE